MGISQGLSALVRVSMKLTRSSFSVAVRPRGPDLMRDAGALDATARVVKLHNVSQRPLRTVMHEGRPDDRHCAGWAF